MKILALDTSTDACSVALLLDGKISEKFEIAPRQHAAIILTMTDELLSECDAKLSDMDAVAFGCGPGSFTGLRIATSAAQGFAFAHDLPLIPVSTLRAIAQGAHRKYKATNVLAALDARMKEVYWGSYSLKENIMHANKDDMVCKPEVIILDNSLEYVGVGNGWESYLEVLKKSCGDCVKEIYEKEHPHAQDIAIIAEYEFQLGNTVSAEEALPVYLRNDVTS